MILEKSFDLQYPASTVFQACCEVIGSIPYREHYMVQPELQTVYALLHDYPAPQGKAIRFLWDKSTAVSLFLQVESNDLQSAKLCVSVESFLVPTIHTVYESASCHFTLAVFMDVLMKLLKDMNLS